LFTNFASSKFCIFNDAKKATEALKQQIEELLYNEGIIKENVEDNDRKKMFVFLIYNLDRINNPLTTEERNSRYQLINNRYYSNRYDLTRIIEKLIKDKLFVNCLNDYDKCKFANCLNAVHYPYFGNELFIGFATEQLNKSIRQIGQNESTMDYSFESVGHALHDYKNLAQCILFEDNKLVLKLKGSKNNAYFGPDIICFSPIPDAKTIKLIEKHKAAENPAVFFSEHDISIKSGKNSYGAILFEVPWADICKERCAKSLGTRYFKKSQVPTIILTENDFMIDVDGNDILDVVNNDSAKFKWDSSTFYWKKLIGKTVGEENKDWENLEIDVEAKELKINKFKIHFVYHKKFSCIKENDKCSFDVETSDKKKELISEFSQFLTKLNIDIEASKDYFDEPTFYYLKKLSMSE